MGKNQKNITIGADDILFVKDWPKETRQLVLGTLSQYGVVVVNMKAGDRHIALENLSQLSEIFGEIIPHKPGELVTDVTTKPEFNDRSVIRPQSDNGPQTPHVDGVLMKNPPTLMAMYCLQSPIRGGEMVFLDMKEAIQHILKSSPHLLAPLFRYDAVTVIRPHMKRICPVLRLECNIIFAYYSSHEYNDAIPHPEVKEAFLLLSSYVKNPANQTIVNPNSGTLVMYVNRRVLHGRLGFTDIPGKERHYVRAWYDGNNSAVTPHMKGITLNESEKLELQKLLELS